MGWLSGLWQVLKALPALLSLIKDLMSRWVTAQNDKKRKENEEIRKEAESAKTPEEKQKAVDHAANRWGGH